MIRTAVARPIGTSMGALAVALLGVVSALRLPVDLLPALELPRVSVQVGLPNAAAAEVEALVTIPVEQALSGVPGVREVDSTSRDGRAVVTLAFPWATDLDLAILAVRERVDEVRYALPEAADPPTVRRWDPGNRPFLVLAASSVDDGALAGGAQHAARLVDLGRVLRELLRPRLEQIEGVASAELVGDREEQALVEIDAARARLLDVTAAEVAEAIRGAVTVPESGTLRKGPYRYSLRVPALVQSASDLERVVVSAPGRTPRVRLGDVARVGVVPAEPETALRFDGAPAVGTRLYKDAAGNALALTDVVAEVLDAFKAEHPGIRIDVAREQAGFIRAALGGAAISVALGGALAFGILFLFLGDWRQPFVIGVVVPVSVLGALAAMEWLNVSINLISLGGLALGIGLLVNTAIIVVENVHRQREKGLGPAAAAVAGTAQVAAPVTSVTVTTLVVFLPVVAVGGFAGALFRDQAVTVSVAVLVAWTAALTLVPALSALLAGRGAVRSAREPWTPVLRPLLHALLRRRWAVAAAAAALAVTAAVLALLTPREIAPPVDTGEVSLTATPRRGMPIAHLERAAARVEATLLGAGAQRVLTTAGLQVDNALTGDGSASRSEVRAQFRLPAAARPEALVRAVEARLPGFEVSAAPTATPLHDVLGLLAGPVEVAFAGRDLAALQRAAAAFVALVTGQGDLGRVVAAPPDPEPQIRLALDRDALGALGVTAAEVAEQVGYVTRGETVAALHVQDPPLPVVVWRPPAPGGDTADSAEAIGRIPIAPRRSTASGADDAERPPPVPLGLLGAPVTERAAAEIVRRGHQRVLTVGVAPDGVGRAELERRLGAALGSLPMPAEVRAQVRTRSTAAAESLAALRWVLVVSLVLVALCLAAEFESVRLSLAVLLAVPLTLAGVAAAWQVFGLTANVFTMMAAAVLIGIGVDDAVVMVDAIRRRHAGAEPGGVRTAIVEAALLRVRPILMTTVTTVLAVAPLALAAAPAQELQRALALTLIGGLLVGTVLTICVVPVLYALLAPAPRKRIHTPAVSGTPAKTDPP